LYPADESCVNLLEEELETNDLFQRTPDNMPPKRPAKSVMLKSHGNGIHRKGKDGACLGPNNALSEGR